MFLLLLLLLVFCFSSLIVVAVVVFVFLRFRSFFHRFSLFKYVCVYLLVVELLLLSLMASWKLIVAAIEIRHIYRHQILVIPSHRRRIFKTFFDFSLAQHTNAVTCSIISNYNDKKNDKWRMQYAFPILAFCSSLALLARLWLTSLQTIFLLQCNALRRFLFL